MSHIDLAPLSGLKEQLQPKGCDVTMIEGGGAEGTGGVSIWMNATIWAEWQGGDDGGCCFQLSKLSTVAHVGAMDAMMGSRCCGIIRYRTGRPDYKY